MMRSFYKVFIVLLLSTSSFLSVAQSGYIDSLFILPQTPTTIDPISVVCHAYFTSGDCDLVSSKTDFNGEMIEVTATHIIGPLTYICHTIDTIPLGVFTPGNYMLVYHLKDSIWNYGTNETTDTLYFTVQPTSIQEFGDPTSFDIFPNPVSVLLNITLLDHLQGRFNLFDSYGNKIQTGSLRDIYSQINVSHLASGVYYIEVVTETQKGVKKFVKH